MHWEFSFKFLKPLVCLPLVEYDRFLVSSRVNLHRWKFDDVREGKQRGKLVWKGSRNKEEKLERVNDDPAIGLVISLKLENLAGSRTELR